MTHQDPEQRPTAEEALRQWSDIRGGIYTLNKEWRPRPREDDILGIAAVDVASLYDVSIYFTRAIFGGLYERLPHGSW
jgi:hypothetical protein